MDYPPNPPQYPNTSYPPNAPTYQVPAQPGTYPPPPYPPGRPPYQKPPKKGAPWGWIVAIILVALAAYFSGYEAGASGREPGSAPGQTITQAPTTTTQGTAAAAPTPKPTQPPAQKWTTVQTFTGTGGKNTPRFTVGDKWRIVWECTVVPAGYDTAPFYLTTYHDDKSFVLGGEVDSSCKAKKGDSEVDEGGTLYLNVNTVVDISWKIQIQELK
jgi:hypothetical protein